MCACAPSLTLPMGALIIRGMTTQLLPALAAVALAAAALPSQSWFQRLTAANPGPRLGHALAFDAARNRTVLFGGQTTSFYQSVTNQTWTYDGLSWTNMAPSALPAARRFHAMAYDPLRQKVVLFGGDRGTLPVSCWGDTWEWDGVSWAFRVLAVSPSERAEHQMAFDAVRGRVVLYGGGVVGTSSTSWTETWEYDGLAWVQRFPLSIPPIGTAGGSSMVTGPNGRCRYFQGGLVSEFDGNGAGSWTPVSSSMPGLGYASHDLSLGTSGEMLVVRHTSSSTEVYEVTSSQWVLRPTTTAPSNREALWVLDTTRGVQVVYSGLAFDTQTWEFDNNARLATAVASGQGCGTPPLQLASAPGSKPLLGSTFTTRAQPVPTAVTFMALGLSDTWLGPLQLPLDLGGLGFTGCRLYHDAVVIDVNCSVAGTVASGLTWKSATFV
jgi:hypothetical protein